jgi:hypothetical protein
MRTRVTFIGALGIAGVIAGTVPAEAVVLAAPGEKPVQAKPVAASAKATYWTFKNKKTGTCLTAGKVDNGKDKYGKAFLRACPRNGSDYQKWDWVEVDGYPDYKYLKNKRTGLCLTARIKKVETAKCLARYSDEQGWLLKTQGPHLFNESWNI